MKWNEMKPNQLIFNKLQKRIMPQWTTTENDDNHQWDNNRETKAENVTTKRAIYFSQKKVNEWNGMER